MDSFEKPLDIDRPNSIDEALAREEQTFDLLAEVIADHSRLLDEYDDIKTERDQLLIDLKNANTDPLTGFWQKGPGYLQVEALMSLVENNLAGLIDAEGVPNALLAIGLDVEGLHYTNNWYSQKSGDTRLFYAGHELREAASIIRDSSRTEDRRGTLRDNEHRRHTDVLIRTGGDEFMAVYPFIETMTSTKEIVAETVAKRLAEQKKKYSPSLRIMYKIGFFTPNTGQTAEDLYHSVEPKASFSRQQRLARPIFKIVRLGLGHYKPPTVQEL